MSRLLLALPFALLPLALAHAHGEHDHDHEAHGSLGAHEHGVAALDVAVEDSKLEIHLDSPAMNIVGFEHAASSDEDKKKLADAQALLKNPLPLFGIAGPAGCELKDTDLDSPLFGDHGHKHEHEHEHEHDEEEAEHEHGHEHSDIDATYEFACEAPERVSLDLSGFFEQFPGTHQINVQAIGPNGQQGARLTPDSTALDL